MKIAVDFDHTLLRSQDLLLETGKFMEVDKFLKAYANIEGFHTIEKHALEIIKIEPFDYEHVIKELSKYYDLASEYLYPDAIPFLEALKKKGYEVDIVSKGNMNHQMKTIISSGVYKFVNKIFVVEDKNFENGYSIVVGDSESDYVLAKVNNAKLIRVKRGKYKDTEFPSDYVVNDLYEALEVIKCIA